MRVEQEAGALLPVEQVPEIGHMPCKGLPSCRTQGNARARLPADEILGDFHIACGFECVEMRRQIAVGRTQQLLQLAELHGVALALGIQRRRHAQAHRLVNDLVRAFHHSLLSHRPPAMSAPPPNTAIHSAKCCSTNRYPSTMAMVATRPMMNSRAPIHAPAAMYAMVQNSERNAPVRRPVMGPSTRNMAM